jgi:hypothetical protein
MNSKNLVILIFLSQTSFSMVSMEPAQASNQKKCNEDKNRLIAALSMVEQDHGTKCVMIETKEERAILFEKFIGSWYKRVSKEEPFDRFDHYLEEAGISGTWIEEWGSKREVKWITISDFTDVIKNLVRAPITSSAPRSKNNS